MKIGRITRKLTAFRIFILLLLFILLHHQIYKKDQTKATFQSNKSDEEKKTAIHNAFKHAWKGYKDSAWGYDELHPNTRSGSNWFHLGLTIIDALDTAYIMQDFQIYEEAKDWVKHKLSYEQEGESNVFEITIRVLGGFLSAHHLSNDKLFLDKAIELADKLLVAFDTPSKIPLSSINLKENRGIGTSPGASTAEAATLQMEFKYLTYLTKNPKYWNAAQAIMQTIFNQERKNGLVPIFIDNNSGKFVSNQIRLGSRGDSYYEYLAKQWLLTSQIEGKYLKEYESSVLGIRSILLDMSAPNKLLFVGETDLATGTRTTKMDHLVCFLPGTLAWKASKGKFISQEDRLAMDPTGLRDLELAEDLTRSCVEMYEQTITGLASEIVFWKEAPSDSSYSEPLLRYHKASTVDLDFDHKLAHSVPFNNETDANTRFAELFKERGLEQDFSIHRLDGHNLLRPETVESLFILYRITGKRKYREWGWNIFLAFEKFARVEAGGYSSLEDVRVNPPHQRDKMETFFLGETLKYLYLLFCDIDVYPLDKYVFNTEAHPFPIFDVSSDTKLMKELLFL